MKSLTIGVCLALSAFLPGCGEAIDPTACTDDLEPVCGRDRVTYSNACVAARAGVSVAYAEACLGCVNDEECDSEWKCVDATDLPCHDTASCLPNVCMPSCHDNADCGDDRVCYPPTKLCEPECSIACLVYDPACGEDGVTYACGAEDAHCHGVRVAHEGECGGDCRETGCSEGWTCDDCEEGWVCLSPEAGACAPAS